METIAGAPLLWMIVLSWLIRAMIRAGHTENNDYSANLTLIPAQANESQIEIEKMTPKYLPVPGESGDGNDRDIEIEM